MKRDRRQYSVTSGVVIGVALCFLLNPPVWAQFTDSFQTNIIDGVVSNWQSHSYFVGSNTVYDQLQIVNGGTLSGGIFVRGFNIGYNGDSNSVIVNGPGSTLVSGLASCELYVGNGGSGNQLSITGGGKVIQTWGIVGTYGNSNSVVVSGAGSVWSNTVGFVMGQALQSGLGAGYFGTGYGNSLIVSNGGTAFTAVGIGFRGGDTLFQGDVVGGTNNSILITGAGSRYRSLGLGLGDGPYATGNSLVISNSGSVTMSSALIGFNGGFNNIAIVTGTGSVLRLSKDLYLNYSWNFGPPASASNSLLISDGGTVRDLTGYVGNQGGDGARVVVTGGGSVWSNVTALFVGYVSRGAGLVISNGGLVVSAGAGYVGSSVGLSSYSANNNSVLVTDSGSVWSNRGSLYVGDGNCSGNSLVISNRGVVFAGGSGLIGGSSVDDPVPSANSNSVLVTGSGSVWSNQGSVYVGGIFGSGNALAINNGGTVAASNVAVAANNSIALNNGNLIAANGLVVSNGALLKGTGTIFADLTLAGTLAPGNSPGAITNFGNLTLQTTAVLDMQLGGTIQGAEYDFVLVTNGTVTLNGLLQVSFINGFASTVSSNDTFVLLQGNSPLGGSFTNVIGGFVTTAGGEGTFYVDYSNNAVTLSGYQAIVPEPSTLALCAVALVSLFGARRKIASRRT